MEHISYPNAAMSPTGQLCLPFQVKGSPSKPAKGRPNNYLPISRLESVERLPSDWPEARERATSPAGPMECKGLGSLQPRGLFGCNAAPSSFTTQSDLSTDILTLGMHKRQQEVRSTAAVQPFLTGQRRQAVCQRLVTYRAGGVLTLRHFLLLQFWPSDSVTVEQPCKRARLAVGAQSLGFAGTVNGSSCGSDSDDGEEAVSRLRPDPISTAQLPAQSRLEQAASAHEQLSTQQAEAVEVSISELEGRWKHALSIYHPYSPCSAIPSCTCMHWD